MIEASARSLRKGERFLIDPPLSAQFGASVVSVCDISSQGARFRHGHPVEMGQKAVLRLAVDGRPAPVALEAVVIWTHTESADSGRFVSGVRTYASADTVDGMLRQLQTSRRTQRIEEMRSADRFFVAPYLNAEFDSQSVRIEDISRRGSRLESMRKIEPGTTAPLRFGIPHTPVIAEVNATVVWSDVKSVDPIRYRAGLVIDDKPELMRLAIGQLVESGRATIDTHSLTLKLRIIRARARQLAPQIAAEKRGEVPPEQYVLVQSVREELRLNPDEAMHWYRRARLLIRDPQTRVDAPAIADHPDALAVWEYLDRSVDPSIIGRTFDLPSR
jgi:hypothetical protein